MAMVSCKSICTLLMAAVVLVAPPSEAAISCGTVVSYVQSCLPYVTNKGPLGSCCSGVKGLNAAAKTKEDRQSVCNCLKSLVGSYSGINLGKVAGLPGVCGVSIPYKISPSTDCSKYVLVNFTVICNVFKNLIDLLGIQDRAVEYRYVGSHFDEVVLRFAG
ncbi:UNVERIFIED_CONTAM: Non-specific lipid-transfer protein 2 [Sesamum radiatum]|uniref:Non-specific lipid-transfer protein n=1 Tax=Sesamum radiatum TaxID=300843 RepID=A0AAW2KVU1_SESRA